MDGDREILPPQESQLLKVDTLSAVHRHGREIGARVFAMDGGLTEDLIGEISESQRLPKIDYSHPFGYYQIPVTTVDFKSEISAPVDVQFVSNNHVAFKKRPDRHAAYDPFGIILF